MTTLAARDHVVFMDGATGYLGRWTLFWLLEELADERVAVLIRPRSHGSEAHADVERRLDEVLRSIGMQSERKRVSAIPGDLALPSLGNSAALDDLRAAVWLHVAGDVRFKPRGDATVSSANAGHTANFFESAAAAKHRPRAVCHTSTFYVHAKHGASDDIYQVPEEFLPPDQMEHDNAYGHSKLQAESYLAEHARRGAWPFRVLMFRPDIVAHHIPVSEVARHRPGLLVDDYKMIFQLVAALLGRSPDGVGAGGDLGPMPRLKYLPADVDTRVYTSDVDSITRAMAQLALLSGDGGAGFGAVDRYRVFNLVNRWNPFTVGTLLNLCQSLEGECASAVEVVPAHQFWTELLPCLAPADRLKYAALVEPFAAYLTRPTTEASTRNVDDILGTGWHNLHPRHGHDIAAWFRSGVQAAFPSFFAQGAV